MSSPFAHILSSGMFTFNIGKELRSFDVHQQLVYNHSMPLRVIMNRPSIQPKRKSVDLHDVEVGVFARFCEFLYFGNYTDAPPTPKKFDSIEEEVAFSESNSLSGHSIASEYLSLTQIGSSSSKLSQLLEGFMCQQFSTMELESYSPGHNNDLLGDYSTVLLGHAKLYVFAEKYDIATLMELALFKLHRTLITFILEESRTGQVMSLLEFVARKSSPGSPIFDMMTIYIGCKTSVMIKNRQFLEFLANQGPMVPELTAIIADQLQIGPVYQDGGEQPQTRAEASSENQRIFGLFDQNLGMQLAYSIGTWMNSW